MTIDADLFVELGAWPTETSYDCRPYVNDSNESCHLRAEAETDAIYVGVKGWATSSYFEIVSVNIPD